MMFDAGFGSFGSVVWRRSWCSWAGIGVPAFWQSLRRLFRLVASAHNLLQLKGMAERKGFKPPVQVGTVNFRISAGGEGEDPAKGQRRQSSAASGHFESSIDNRLRTGEKQAMKKDLDAAIGKATRW
jgi:hypothetical protein